MTLATATPDQRTTARSILTAKEYEAWEATEVKGMTLRGAANHCGISYTSVRERLANATRKINRYSRDDFPANPKPLVPNDQDASFRTVISLLIQRDGPCCYLCQREVPPDRAHVEHIIPRSEGGTNDPANLALGCDNCNAVKGANYVSLRITSGRPVYHPT